MLMSKNSENIRLKILFGTSEVVRMSRDNGLEKSKNQ
jgi:hypothetical protein